jgi:mannose-6-phosphate isomerase-like protein (cupin superfamily)/CDGSH-type Zn-finger protein
MDKPEIAQYKPCLVNVEEGKRYFWCTCGRSKRQPFCDSSHRGTDFLPLVWTADKTEEKLFCACKRTRSEPFCDGTHNSLSDTYAEATEKDGANARLVDYESAPSGALRASLDNGCYVIRVPDSAMQARGTLRLFPTISADEGANHLSQYSAIADQGESPIVCFPGSDVALFAINGSGVVRIGDREFDIGRETGVAIKPGEGFQLVVNGDEPLLLNITVCPHCPAVEFPDAMPDHFDSSVTDRVQGVDESKTEAMGDRFYQVLVDHESHNTPITQFIGEVPQSRAAHHHHLYEEAIMVLSGEGFMWTDDTKTPVMPGDTIFLPLKQAHSLECTSPDGMRLVGLFYPSMSPAINY